jgi:hypothetical protein
MLGEINPLGEAPLDFSASADLEAWLAMHPNFTPQQNA